MSDSSEIDFSTSNMILTIGGQILVIVLLLMLALFGVNPEPFPANEIRQMLNKKSLK